MKKKSFLPLLLISIIVLLLFRLKKLKLKIKTYRANKRLKKYIKISLNSNDNQEISAAYYMIANIYMFDLKDYESAIEYYKKIINSKDKNYLEDSALFNLGLAYKFISQKDNAKKTFIKILENYPNTARARDAELELSRL